MFQPGDTVVYHHHVCTIAGIREAYFEGRDYFELHALFKKSLKLYVAIEDATPPNLREAMSREEALALIDSIPDAGPIEEAVQGLATATPTLAERKVKEEYEKHLKTFSPYDLIPIMKSVQVRTEMRKSMGRAITATDKKYFDMAEGLLCDELSISLCMDRDEVHDYLVERVKQAEAAR